jgi:transglutaminase-like putative cysteine protease
MTLHIRHVTQYRYEEPVSISQHLVHLTPRSMPSQACLRHILTIDPSPQFSSQRQDYFGNTVTYFSMQTAHQSLTIEAQSDVSVTPPVSLLFNQTLNWESAAERLKWSLSKEDLQAREFVFESPQVKWNGRVASYAAASFPPRRCLLESVLNLTQRIHQDFTFDTKATEVRTPVSEVFEIRRGVCQDFAHLQIACLRSLGLAARYVSGYLYSNSPSGDLNPGSMLTPPTIRWAPVFMQRSPGVETTATLAPFEGSFSVAETTI